MRRNRSDRPASRRWLLAAATLALAATGADNALAEQCIYNHFGKSGLIIKVDWYDTGNVVIHHNVAENKIEVFSKGGQFEAPQKLKSETITAGFSSCVNDMASRTAVVSVVGGKIARIAAQKGAALAGGLVSGVVAGGACAASAGVAIGTAGTGSPAAAVLCIGSGVKATSLGYTVSGVLSNLIPAAKDVVYAGVPSHYNYINIGGTAFDPWFEVGSKIDTKPPILPMPIMHNGPAASVNAEDLCTTSARERNMRWNGEAPVVIPPVRRPHAGDVHVHPARGVPLHPDPVPQGPVRRPQQGMHSAGEKAGCPLRGHRHPDRPAEQQVGLPALRLTARGGLRAAAAARRPERRGSHRAARRAGAGIGRASGIASAGASADRSA